MLDYSKIQLLNFNFFCHVLFYPKLFVFCPKISQIICHILPFYTNYLSFMSYSAILYIQCISPLYTTCILIIYTYYTLTLQITLLHYPYYTYTIPIYMLCYPYILPYIAIYYLYYPYSILWRDNIPSFYPPCFVPFYAILSLRYFYV
jgi:hypothetical protein